MEGEIWMAEDFDAPLDDLFDCLKTHVANPLDQV
jgi:RNAse (barnase) inhibitor barstar